MYFKTGEEQFDRQLNIKGQAVIANRLPIKVNNKPASYRAYV
ncbi:hypothetical protein AAHB65_13990 [Bacillus toyonensis]